MAFNPNNFPLGPVWETLDDNEKQRYMNLAFSRLSSFGVGSVAAINSPEKEAAFAQYLKLIVDLQATGDLEVPDYLQDLLTTDGLQDHKTGSHILNFTGGGGIATSGTLTDEQLRNVVFALVYSWAQAGNDDPIPSDKLINSGVNMDAVTAEEVARILNVSMSSWAFITNDDPIPASKLTLAPNQNTGGTGLTSDQVRALISDWAETSNQDKIPLDKIPDLSSITGGLPIGGAVGSILVKQTTDDYAAAWENPQWRVPVGGNTGQVLKKRSTNDYDFAWEDEEGNPGGVLVPTGNTFAGLDDTAVPTVAPPPSFTYVAYYDFADNKVRFRLGGIDEAQPDLTSGLSTGQVRALIQEAIQRLEDVTLERFAYRASNAKIPEDKFPFRWGLTGLPEVPDNFPVEIGGQRANTNVDVNNKIYALYKTAGLGEMHWALVQTPMLASYPKINQLEVIQEDISDFFLKKWERRKASGNEVRINPRMLAYYSQFPIEQVNNALPPEPNNIIKSGLDISATAIPRSSFAGGSTQNYITGAQTEDKLNFTIHGRCNLGRWNESKFPNSIVFQNQDGSTVQNPSDTVILGSFYVPINPSAGNQGFTWFHPMIRVVGQRIEINGPTIVNGRYINNPPPGQTLLRNWLVMGLEGQRHYQFHQQSSLNENVPYRIPDNADLVFEANIVNGTHVNINVIVVEPDGTVVKFSPYYGNIIGITEPTTLNFYGPFYGASRSNPHTTDNANIYEVAISESSFADTDDEFFDEHGEDYSKKLVWVDEEQVKQNLEERLLGHYRPFTHSANKDVIRADLDIVGSLSVNGGQLNAGSTQGLNQAAVDARIRANVPDWAQSGNTEDIPRDKLDNAPGANSVTLGEVSSAIEAQVEDWAKTGIEHVDEKIPESRLPDTINNVLTQDQVDARVKAGVKDWAEADSISGVPIDQIPKLTEAKLPNGTVVSSELSPSNGAILYYDVDPVPANNKWNIIPIGSEDQVLSVTSAGELTWKDETGGTGASLPSGTSGALLRHDGTNWVALPKGTRGQYLGVDVPTGNVQWEDNPLRHTGLGDGDILVYSFDNHRFEQLDPGSVGQVLTIQTVTTANGTAPKPRWANIPTPTNTGLTESQVDARVRAGVYDWAEQGNADRIPLSKLPTNIGSGGTGTQLPTATLGAILAGRADGTWVIIPRGTSGQYLGIDVLTNLPTWEDNPLRHAGLGQGDILYYSFSNHRFQSLNAGTDGQILSIEEATNPQGLKVRTPHWINPPITLPAGGGKDQVLSKKSITDYDTQWIDLPTPTSGGGSTSGGTGTGNVFRELIHTYNVGTLASGVSWHDSGWDIPVSSENLLLITFDRSSSAGSDNNHDEHLFTTSELRSLTAVDLTPGLNTTPAEHVSLGINIGNTSYHIGRTDRNRLVINNSGLVNGNIVRIYEVKASVASTTPSTGYLELDTPVVNKNIDVTTPSNFVSTGWTIPDWGEDALLIEVVSGSGQSASNGYGQIIVSTNTLRGLANANVGSPPPFNGSLSFIGQGTPTSTADYHYILGKTSANELLFTATSSGNDAVPLKIRRLSAPVVTATSTSTPTRSGNLVSDETPTSSSTAVLPEGFENDYTNVVVNYNSGGFIGSATFATGYLASLTTTTELRWQGSDRGQYNPTTRTLEPNTSGNTGDIFVWVELS